MPKDQVKTKEEISYMEVVNLAFNLNKLRGGIYAELPGIPSEEFIQMVAIAAQIKISIQLDQIELQLKHLNINI